MDGLLPDNAWRNNKWWCNRRDILGAIEMGDFSKVALESRISRGISEQ